MNRTPDPRNCEKTYGGYTASHAIGALPKLAVERGQKDVAKEAGQGRE